MRTLAFVQARMSSRRLPGKVLQPLAGRPALERVVERLGRASGLDEVVVLTSTDPSDDPVAELARRLGVGLFRGSLYDVLDRFNGAAVELQAERVIRVTADCPLVDPELVERLLTLRESAGTVYAAVATGPPIAERSPRRYPDGLDSEVFSATALERAAAEATDAWDREHVTPYIKRELAADSCALLEAEEDWADERWTVDYPEDLAFAKSVYDHFGDTPFGYRDVFELLEREPRLRQINAIRAA